ncbi:MAG TPA: PD-(D/E)XK nuclease family protein [Chitinophagales bacterium]|nr:PD-(D/E)XK nuclease family protein [Chitinophagales bacterium]
MKKFLERTAEQIVAKHGRNLSNVLVLMPNQRSCTYFKNELNRQAEQTVFAPEILTLTDWMLAQSQLVVADNIELVRELYACHKEIGGAQTLDEFMSTANVMLNDFNELDMQLTDAKSFFKNLNLLQSMKIYEPGESPTEYKLQYKKFWEDFGKMYYLLRDKLLAAGKGYVGLVLREVAERLVRDKEATSKVSIAYLIGFSHLNKSEEAVITWLLNHTTAEVIWDADNYYVRDEMKEAGSFFREYKNKLRTGEKQFTNGISTTLKKVQVIGAAKNVGQVKVVADILQNQLKLNEENAIDTVVVVPDEKLLSPLVANIPANITALNITMGLTIAGSNPASFLDILFRLYHNSQKYQSKNRPQRFYYKDVFDLLQHSYLRLLFGDIDTGLFVETMKKQNRVLIRKEELEKAFGKTVSPIFFEGTDTLQFAGYLQQFITTVLDKLVTAVDLGNSALAPDAEIAFRLLTILNNTQSVFSSGENISIKTYTQLLKEDFYNTRVPLEGDPVQGLQVMGLLETRALDFKNVIILSANEGILPGGKNMRSYIPYEMRYEFLTTHKERDAATAYLFYRLFHQAENIFILYNTEPDELGGGEKSRFILQLEQELKPVNPQAEVRDMIFAIDPPPALEETPIIIKKDDFILQKLEGILTESGLSPSALNTYINCSLQYYFRYIAGLREQEDMEENMEAATIGSAVHYALEKIYMEKVGQVVSPEFVDAQLKNKPRIEQLIREHLAKRFESENLKSGKNLLLFKVCVKLTEEYLKHEKKTIEQQNEWGNELRIEMLEDKLEHVLPINGKQIKVAGRVDRIESVGGVVQIADYKTTKISTIPILNEETWAELISDPKFSKPVQLLVYAWLYNRIAGKPVPVRSGIYWLRDNNKSLDTLRIDKQNDILGETEINRFEEKLVGVLTEMLNEETPFTKTKDIERCEFCEFARICERT